MLRTLALAGTLSAALAMPAGAVTLSPSDLDRGAAMIRAQGQPCVRITSVSRINRSTYRVRCGPHAYRVTVTALGGLSLSRM